MSFKELGHCRLASAAKGDDATLTRYIRIDGVKRSKRHQPRLPTLAAPFIEQGRTKFGKRVFGADEVSTLLVNGHSNVKIGRDVRKGQLRGYWIYTLSLEERATCPRSCGHWQSCYGNNMPYAKRLRHGPELLDKLEREIADLLAVRGRRGILIRLHALGDFYDVDYVGFWQRMLAEHPRLSIFGYTAWGADTPIGMAVGWLRELAGGRFAVRHSNGGLDEWSTVSVVDDTPRPGAFLCPEQTGQTRCCATCAACWSTSKNVAFQEH